MSKCKLCQKTIEWVKTSQGWRAWDPQANIWHNIVCESRPGRKKKISEVDQVRIMALNFEQRNSEDAFSGE